MSDQEVQVHSEETKTRLSNNRTLIILTVSFICLAILCWPIISLFLSPGIKFDLQLFALTVILVSLFVFILVRTIKRNLPEELLFVILGVLLSILFFLSDVSKDDLSTIQDLAASHSYNCLVAEGILNDNKVINSISYSQYEPSILFNDLGFIFEKYGTSTQARVGIATYQMNYSNKLLIGTTNLDTPAFSTSTLAAITSHKTQLSALATEISNALNCSATRTEKKP